MARSDSTWYSSETDNEYNFSDSTSFSSEASEEVCLKIFPAYHDRYIVDRSGKYRTTPTECSFPSEYYENSVRAGGLLSLFIIKLYNFEYCIKHIQKVWFNKSNKYFVEKFYREVNLHEFSHEESLCVEWTQAVEWAGKDQQWLLFFAQSIDCFITGVLIVTSLESLRRSVSLKPNSLRPLVLHPVATQSFSIIQS